jgi:hypothetical protein
MAELKAWEPSNRDKLASWIQSMLEAGGMERAAARRHARSVTGTTMGTEQVGGIAGTGMGVLDFTPLALGFGAEEGGKMAGQGVAQVQAGDVAQGAAGIGMGLLAAVPGLPGKGGGAARSVLNWEDEKTRK